MVAAVADKKHQDIVSNRPDWRLAALPLGRPFPIGTRRRDVCSNGIRRLQFMRVSLLPRPRGNRHGIKSEHAPPLAFIARAVQFAVMAAAERYSEFVADLATERDALRKA